MNIDPNKPADKPTEELTEKELDGIAGGVEAPLADAQMVDSQKDLLTV